jgi:hypothetical protein
MMQSYLTKRNTLWAIALALTLWLTWQTHQEEQTSAERTTDPQSYIPAKSSIRTQSQTNADLEDFSLASREASANDIINLFATPQKAVKDNAKLAQTPIKPTAPPLPFEFIGILQEQGVSKLIVNYSDDVAVLKIGDILGSYQLTSANKIGGSMQFQFLYLPMKITQTMVVNDAN